MWETSSEALAVPQALHTLRRFDLSRWRDRFATAGSATARLCGCDPQWLGGFVLLLALNRAWNTLVFHLAKFTELGYFRPVLVVEAFRYGPTLLLAVLLLLSTGLAWRYRAWSSLGTAAERSFPLRGLMTFVAAILAWAFSTYDYNAYFDQGHYLDRVLLVGLALLVWRSPLAVAPFVSWALIVVHQFKYPLQGYTWTDKRVLFDVLILFQAWLSLRWLADQLPWARGRLRADLATFVTGLLCLQAANYFLPGLCKLRIAWLQEERLDFLFAASYFNGWLGRLRPADVLSWAGMLRSLNPLLVLGALAIELAAILVLVSRWSCAALLAGWIALHAAICASAGVFFWKWILLDAGLIAALLRMSPAVGGEVFGVRRGLLGGVTIALGTVLFNPVPLAWYDTRYNEFYRIDAVDSAGRVRTIADDEFGPYDVVFAQSRFHYLNPRRCLVGTYGTTDRRDLARALNSLTTPRELARLRQGQGTCHFDEARARDFDRFIRRRFALSNRGDDDEWLPWWLQPPPHLMSSHAEAQPHDRRRIEKVRIVSVRGLYLDDELHILAEDVVREIQIPRDPENPNRSAR